MGLDLVEMVMRVEEEFDIEIPDEIAETMTTPKKVIEYVIEQPNVRVKMRPRESIANQIWMIIEDEGGVLREDYNEESRFIEDMGLD